MRIVLCGTLVPPEYETRIENLSNAGNRFLLNMYNELIKKDEVNVLSYVAVSTIEEIRRKLRNQKGWSYFFKSGGLLKSIHTYNQRIKNDLKKADCLITYNVFYPWMGAVLAARGLKKKSVLILADYSPVESYGNIKQKIYARVQSHLMRKYDVVVGLSSNTRKYVTERQKFICIEGGISEDFYNRFEQSCDDDRSERMIGNNEGTDEGTRVITLMYSGLLSKVTGIDMLIQAFESVNTENLRLVISGKGELSAYVEQKSKNNDKIKYLGLLEYDDYIEKLKKADILINPRNMELPENANNFPSKIMEYLATGKTIISTKFPGHEKFEENIFFADSNVDGLKNAIESQCKVMDSSRQRIYESNREFCKQFLWSTQCDRIRSEIKL